LSSNLVERWLGLAKIQLQTASGSATAEMTVEGVREVEALRDFFYARMRGARGESGPGPDRAIVEAQAASTNVAVGADMDELTRALNAVAAELRALRLDRQATRLPPDAPP
jgi:putative membrane protein